MSTFTESVVEDAALAGWGRSDIQVFAALILPPANPPPNVMTRIIAMSYWKVAYVKRWRASPRPPIEALEDAYRKLMRTDAPTLVHIARELIATVKKNVAVDWTVHENARAQLRVVVKRILRKYGYPPDKQEKATQTVLDRRCCCRRTGRRPSSRAIRQPVEETTMNTPQVMPRTIGEDFPREHSWCVPTSGAMPP